MHARSDVEKSADSMLANGMEGKNQNQMALAMQVLIPIVMTRTKFILG